VSERTEALRAWFPVPYVAIVVLLLVLIVLTPNLLSTAAPSAGSLPTEAELIIDRAPSDNATHLYVHGIGEVRYTSISMSVATGLTWPPPTSARNLSFGLPSVWRNALESSLATGSDPFAVNITAVYVDTAGTTVDFVGIYAFDVARETVSEVGYLPPAPGVTTTPVDQLPFSILLETVAPGASP